MLTLGQPLRSIEIPKNPQKVTSPKFAEGHKASRLVFGGAI